MVPVTAEPVTAVAPGRQRALPRATHVEVAAVSALLLFGAAVIFWAGRFFDFWYDEWSVILYRRQGGLDALLAPHNGHLFLTSHALYRVLFAVVGLRHYWPYQASMVVAHLAAVV